MTFFYQTGNFSYFVVKIGRKPTSGLLTELRYAKLARNFSYFVAKIAIPGNVFPSRNSSEAPPPVET